MRSPQCQVPIPDTSAVGAARRAGARLAAEAGFDETDAGRVAIAVTELATNIVRHAGRGELLLQLVGAPSAQRVELIAIDRGPGMADPERCLRDGYSTSGTSGSGLGAVRRLADEFDLCSQPGAGTVVMARVARGSRPAARDTNFAIGSVCLPLDGEEVCGDAWRVARDESGLSVLVVDGLGHGLSAASAALEATRVFDEQPFASPVDMIQLAHRRMSGTRGGAMASAQIDVAARRIRFAGVGNIAGALVGAAGSRGLASHNGTVGAQLVRVQEFVYDWAPGATLVMHSDGLGTRWQLDRYPGAQSRHPAVIAGLLYRDFTRGRDDVTVVVARGAQA